MNADQEILMFLGGLTRNSLQAIEFKHQVQDLAKRLAEADAKLAALEKAAKADEPPA